MSDVSENTLTDDSDSNDRIDYTFRKFSKFIKIMLYVWIKRSFSDSFIRYFIL